MRLRKRNWCSALAVMFAFMIVIPGDAFGRPKSRSSSRSKPAARRSAPKPRAAKPRAATPKRGAKTGKASNQKNFGSSKKKAGKSKPKTKADQKAYDKAKANGTAFKTRDAAAANYKKKNASKFTSAYASKPATRPGHIPPTCAGAGGTTYNISYNQGHGGYGYMMGGRWTVYDAMADVAMASYYNRQMASAGYAYGPRPVVGMGGGMILLLVIGGIVVILVLGAMMGKSLGSKG